MNSNILKVNLKLSCLADILILCNKMLKINEMIFV